ncbi:MAG: glycerol-3-phosphate dehydrogenase/oxidase, partial [Alphaproteobacteria bacterium]|nr:glycerol-3-phosphate dehydrogenase/oxidase [Alphaproteobacteria bacterium]
DLNRLTNQRFDLLVIGGGITGACIARDAAMRGLSVALIEKSDFAHATSAHNSRLIHGGLRYLRNFELRLVRESLRERRIWQRIAPAYVHPLPFLVPLYGGGWKARATLAAGLTLYDLLAFDRSGPDDPAQRLPRHRWLDAKSALAIEPALDGRGFVGAFEYYDAQMDSPERLALACIMDADAHGAVVANYVQAEGLLFREDRAEGARVADAFSDAEFEVRAAVTVIAAGPWADLFLRLALGKPVSHRLVRSKGIHLVVPPMTQTHALTLATKGGHFFVLPWRGHSLLGTTDAPFTGSPNHVGVAEEDIAAFLAFINAHLPSADLQRGDVKHFYAGLRPLVDDGRRSTYNASRRAELIDHGKDDGVAALYSAIGGKWTTSRRLAEQVVDKIDAKLGKSFGRCRTATSGLPNVPSADQSDVLRAVRAEMALTMEDLVMRRTGVGLLGKPGAHVLEGMSRTMGAEIGWSEERREQEIAAMEHNFHTRESA